MKRRKFISNIALSSAAIITTPFWSSDLGGVNGADKNSGLERLSENNKVREVLRYIQNNWQNSIYKDAPGEGFQGVNLPYPYTAPSIKGQGLFTIFFYWDNYFTNLGLIKDGLKDQAKNNIKNMLWLIDEQGYMPNYVGLHNRSQNPYLQLMVKHYFDNIDKKDESFYKFCAEGLRKEYQFWMTSRLSITGLNHFGFHDDAKACVDFYDNVLVKRLGVNPVVPREEKVIVGGHHIAEAENWDFSQRYSRRCRNHAAVDLNALLYGYEIFLYEASHKLSWNFTDFYNQRAEKRKQLIDQYLWNDAKGFYFDYDFVNDRQSEVYSLAGFQPLYMGIADQEKADKVVKNIDLFERKYGLAVTEEREGCRNFQWGYPVVWPPMVYIAVIALDQYGYKKDAKRIAEKYIDVNTNLFQKHGKLYEKTNAETGDLSNAEYDASAMLGWTAGVYIALVEYLGLKK